MEQPHVCNVISKQQQKTGKEATAGLAVLGTGREATAGYISIVVLAKKQPLDKHSIARI